MERKCTYCDGTGYGSAARNSGNPNMIGIWQCDYCNGKGKHEDFIMTPEEAEKMKIHISRILVRAARNKIKEELNDNQN
jgi:DnaJ-class molecular chaperone